jgi:hypothetical protein
MMALDPVTALLDIGSKVIDRIFPDPTAAASAKLELMKMQQTGELALLTADTDLAKGQLAINQAEAASSSVFVSGWRPALGWICGLAFAWNWVGLPIARFGMTLYGHPIDLVGADMSEMLPVLFGMLGLGGMRSWEKSKGVAR